MHSDLYKYQVSSILAIGYLSAPTKLIGYCISTYNNSGVSIKIGNT